MLLTWSSHLLLLPLNHTWQPLQFSLLAPHCTCLCVTHLSPLRLQLCPSESGEMHYSHVFDRLCICLCQTCPFYLYFRSLRLSLCPLHPISALRGRIRELCQKSIQPWASLNSVFSVTTFWLQAFKSLRNLSVSGSEFVCLLSNAAIITDPFHCLYLPDFKFLRAQKCTLTTHCNYHFLGCVSSFTKPSWSPPQS